MSTLHPDDELLSAALDGEEEAAAAHARTCAVCRGRMASLQAAARAVGEPVAPVAAPVRDAAVARAIREVRAAASGPSPAHRAPRPRALRRWAPWVAAASAAAAAAVAIPVVMTRVSSHPLSASRALKSPSSASPPVMDGGDLGSLSDQVVLRDTVRHQLDAAAGAGTPAQAAAPNQSGPATGSPSGSAGGAGPSGPARSATAGAAAGAGANPSPASSSQCRGPAQQYGGAGLGTLVYAAAVRWQDAPAEVLVFRVPGGSLGYRLFVMARDGCQLLVVQSF